MRVAWRGEKADEIRQVIDDDNERAGGRHGGCRHLPRTGTVDHHLALLVERAHVVQADAVAVGHYELDALGERARSRVAGAERRWRHKRDGCADLVRSGVQVVLGLEGCAPSDVDAAVERAFEVVGSDGGEGEEAEREELHEEKLLLLQRLQRARAVDVERCGDVGVYGVGGPGSRRCRGTRQPAGR